MKFVTPATAPKAHANDTHAPSLVAMSPAPTPANIERPRAAQVIPSRSVNFSLLSV